MPFPGEMAALANISAGELQQKAAVFGKRGLNILLLSYAVDFHPDFCSTSKPTQSRGGKKEVVLGKPTNLELKLCKNQFIK